jgi:hypothetical protein
MAKRRSTGGVDLRFLCGGGAMLRRNKLVDRYVAMWNEPDGDVRRKVVEEIYADDAVYLMFARDPIVGHDAIAEQIGYAHDLYFEQGFVFKSSNNADGHHNLVKFGWVLVSAETGDVHSIGFDVLVLDDDERISSDYQFLSRPAMGDWSDNAA